MYRCLSDAIMDFNELEVEHRRNSILLSRGRVDSMLHGAFRSHLEVDSVTLIPRHIVVSDRGNGRSLPTALRLDVWVRGTFSMDGRESPAELNYHVQGFLNRETRLDC